MCTVSVCCAVLVVGFCVVCAVRWCFRVCSCWGFCYLWSVGVSVRLLPSAAPVISSPNKLHKSSHCLPNLTNRFFCALIPSQKSSPAFLSTIICPPFLSLLLSLSLSLHSLYSLWFIRSFAALLPNTAAYHPSHWLCSPGPAMTVSFTRVSPVSSLSLCQSPAPTAWTRAQPQHRPAEERHDHLCVGRRSSRPFNGENTSWRSCD